MDIDEDDSVGTAESFTKRGVLFKEKNNLTEEKRMWLFENTMEQSNNELWFKERKTRITGSICGRIIKRNHSIYPLSILKSFFPEQFNENCICNNGKITGTPYTYPVFITPAGKWPSNH